MVAGVTALAASLRLFSLGRIPPGLYRDEAFNGLDALTILSGQCPVYFAANHGREPLFIYLAAGTVGLLGRTPGALRLAAAIAGTLTIPATYLMARAWFNRRLALLAAAILSVTFWHVHLSRVGFRAIMLPLTTALWLWLGMRACRSGHWRDWVLTGLLYGVSFYAYLPARFTIFVLAAFALYLWFTGQSERLWPAAAYFVAGTLVAVAPLAAYAAGHWNIVMGRLGQVSVFNSVVNRGNLWGTLGRQLVGTLGMFFVRGDTIPRHNLAGRPVFDPLLAAAMVWGLARAALQARRETASAFTLVWVGLMLVPTWLAEDAPHFLRAVGVLPVLAIFPALGLDALLTWVERRGWKAGAVALACAPLIVGLTATAWDYFVRYGADQRTAYAFEDAATELAAEANRFIGVGWDGNGLVADGGNREPGRHVYVESRLWREWAAVPFLVPATGGVTTFTKEASPSPTGAALLLVWPYDDVKPHLSRPPGARIEVHGGPLARGDLQDTPYVAYVAYAVDPHAGGSGGYLARFGGQIALSDYTIEVRDQEWHVQLEWKALTSLAEDYTVFVYQSDGERVVAQDDGEPAEGYYPTSLWRRGDVVVDTHVLESPAEWSSGSRLVVGLYVWPTMERLEVVGPSGESLGDELVLPVTPQGS